MFLLALEPAASFVKDLSSCVSALQITHFITTREFDFKASRYRAMAFLPSLSPSACRSLYGLEYKSGDTEERERERERGSRNRALWTDGRTRTEGEPTLAHIFLSSVSKVRFSSQRVVVVRTTS